MTADTAQQLADQIRDRRRTQGTLGIPQPKPDADERAS